ncbi:MAG: nucleotidyltransferase domain-containing protein [Candidatus Nanohalobium sp.]
MSSQHREAFEEFAEKAQEELGDSLKKLVLYGSVAKGQESEESDVDVFAVVESQEQKERLEDLAFDVSVEHGVFIVPVIKTVEEFEESKDSLFSREVMETGDIRV